MTARVLAAMAAMNATSQALPLGQDAFGFAGLVKAECHSIDCPRVADAPATLECRMSHVLQLQGEDNWMVIGEVVGVHLRDDCLTDGMLDIRRYHPAVSYTHLDVYKRQARLWQSAFEWLGWTGSSEPTETRCSPRHRRARAVSYTHLDVYKRQSRMRR